MSEMKRLLEKRIEQVLEYYFPDGMDHMSQEEKVKWYATAHRAAEDISNEFWVWGKDGLLADGD